MEPNNQNQYDFILNPQQPQNKPGLPQVQSGKKRLIIFILMIMVLFTVLLLGFNFINSIGKANNESLIAVRAYQVELDRVLTEAITNTGDPATVNRFTTLQATLASDQAQLSQLLTDRGVEVSEEQLAAQEDTEATDALDNESKNGSYDTAVLALISSLSNEYYDTLKTAAANTSSDKEQEILNTSINNLETVANQ
jgi:flagellar basal body-associated protein FliL